MSLAPRTHERPLVEISGLEVAFEGQPRPAVNAVDLSLAGGQCHGVVGESGSGKTLMAMAVAGLLPANARVRGSIVFDGADVLALTPEERRRYRRDNLGVIFQDPMTALDPRLDVATQLRLAFTSADRARGAKWVAERSVALLEKVGITRPGDRLSSFPFELSGGICQRVMIAMAIARNPRLLIADEPTTALDVSVQAQILDLIDRLRVELQMGVILISHELGMVAERSDVVSVMQNGVVVETGPSAEVLSTPRHDYTRLLLESAPSIRAALARPRAANENDRPVHLSLRGISKTFPIGAGRRLTALDGIDLDIAEGESVGIVGESGSGKSTLARIIVGLETADAGSIAFRGADPGRLRGAERRQWRHSTQLVFQDPLSSLDPHMRARVAIEEPLKVARLRGRARRAKKVAELFAEVGLSWELAERLPRQLSGGQRQRVGIARALALGPSLLVADEPVSALDVSVQARILALLERLRRERGITQITISHDLAVIGVLCDTVVILYLGRVLERGRVADVFSAPAHPYTRGLLDAVPGQGRPRAARERLRGELQAPEDAAEGCIFRSRCNLARPECATTPPWLWLGEGHGAACHFPQTSSPDS